MAALHNLPFGGMMRGGKSELHRAGWSVTRTVPLREIAETLFLQGEIRKVPQKRYRPGEETLAPLLQGKGEMVR
jgi:hypothetical protein